MSLDDVSPLDELDSLQKTRQDLETSIGKILSFPEEVTRPCLIPISKTAYFPGRFIHTNEFVVDLPEGSGDLDVKTLKWKSHTQAAAVLQKRLKDIKSRILEIENANADSDLVLMRSVPVAQSNTSAGLPAPVRAVPPVSSTDTVRAPAPTRVPIRAPTKAPSSSSAASLPPNDSLPSFFEIREYEDDSGRVSSEVLDMGRELQNYGSISMAGSGEKAGVDSSKSAVDSKASGIDERAQQAFQALHEKLAQFGNSGNNVSHSGEARGGVVDEEVAFAAELLSAQTNAKVEYATSTTMDLSFMEELEQQEQAETAQAMETERLRQIEKMQEAARMPKEGWKRGFFASDGGSKGKDKVNTQAPVRTAAFTSTIVEKNVT